MAIIIRKQNEETGKLHLELPTFTTVQKYDATGTEYYPEAEFYTAEFTAVTHEAAAYISSTLGIRNTVCFRMKGGEDCYVFTEPGDESVYCNLRYSEDPRELGSMLFHLARALFLKWIGDKNGNAPDRFGPCNRKKIREYPDAAFYADVFAVAAMDLLWPRWDIAGTKKRILSSKKSSRCFMKMKRTAKRRFR